MSEAPVEAFDPPYYVAVFSTVRTQEQSDYRETNARMEELVKDIPGYLGMDHAQNPGGLGITVGYFRDADALTLAELRVLRFLPSYLTLGQSAARLHVSTNTVKTQAHAVYRKLEVSSRAGAVERAAAIGLVDGWPARLVAGGVRNG